jgi:hypothetical protein
VATDSQQLNVDIRGKNSQLQAQTSTTFSRYESHRQKDNPGNEHLAMQQPPRTDKAVP